MRARRVITMTNGRIESVHPFSSEQARQFTGIDFDYTVILLYPDYASENYGQEHYITTIKASNANVAIIRAQQRAFDSSKYDHGATRYQVINDPDDFYVVAVICGRPIFAKL